MIRYLVTGATGHIGSHLVRYLAEHEGEVAALVRPTSNLWRIEDIIQRLHIIRGDLSNIQGCSTAIQEFAPDVIFHLGWYGVDSRYRNEIEHITWNLSGSVNLFHLAHECGCKRWVGLGTSLEYGKYEIPIAENLRPIPDTLYGVSKYSTYLSIQKLSQLYEIDFIWLRPFWLYGAYDDPLRIIPWVILSLLRGEKPALTLGEQRGDYLYMEDAVEAIWQIANTPSAQGIFNLGSGETHTMRSVMECIRDLINPSLPLGFGEILYRPEQSMILEADISRLRQVTGWSPQVSLHEGLKRTVEWFRANEVRYQPQITLTDTGK